MANAARYVALAQRYRDGTIVRRPAPAQHDGAEPGRIDARERRCDERNEGGARLFDRHRVEARQHGELGTGVEGPCHHREPADV